jgi:hypothetical protein
MPIGRRHIHTKQAMYLKRNTEAHSHNQCGCGKTISIHIMRGCIQHAMRMRCTIICDLPGSTVFFPHYLINGMIFEKKVIEHEINFFSFPLQLMSQTFLILRRTERDVIQNVYWSSYEVPLCLSAFSITWFYRHIFGKYSNIKYRKNLSSGSGVVPCGRTDGDRQTGRQTNMMKLIVVFRNFAKPPENFKYVWINQTKPKTKACNAYPNKYRQTRVRSLKKERKYILHSLSLFYVYLLLPCS